MSRAWAGAAAASVLALVSSVARGGGPVAFDPALARPYFASGPAAEAMARFRVEDWAGAAKGFEAYVAAQPKADDHLQATFMSALAASKAGRFLDAARRFDELTTSYPLLADYHRVYAARAWLSARRFSEALERTGHIDESSPLDAEARFARADALAGEKRTAEAAAAYRAYADAFPKSWRLPEAQLRAAEESEALGDEKWPDARAAYRALYIHFPTEPAGRRAEARLKVRDAAALTLTGPERLARGLALFEAQRNAESESELRAALQAGGLDGKQACVASYHLAQSVFKARDRPRAAALFDDAAAACGKAAGTANADDELTDLHMKALYQGARCHAARGEAQLAADLFAHAEAAHPKHSYADDARLRQAEAYDALAQKMREGGDKLPAAAIGGVAPPTAEDYAAKARALLADLADLYPSGDLRSEALFRLFFHAFRDGKLDEAKRWLDVALVKVPREDGWWEAGRTLYWSARVAARSDHPADAKALYARCAREYPLSYYALAALNRMREQWPDEERQLVAELHKPAPTAQELEWRFAPRALFGEPGFRRGVELARLGLGPEAKRELAALGIKPPEKGVAVAGADAEELLWLATVLYDRAGEYALSHWIPRHTLTDYARGWPTGGNRRRWTLSYPRGYAELIVDNAGKNGQPAALEFAIVREESAFDPLTESFANAVGLTQLTPPPAKRFAQGLPYSREALRDPAINVAIGARELGYLWKYYDHDAALVIAGYNAGEGAVNRWLKAAPKEAAGDTLDAYIEAIPYDETRGYTKRVLASWFAYHWLYQADGEDPVPPLPNGLPKRKAP
jgi:soluble lytic murein transglycosylase